MKTYRGSCHCGAVSFEIEADLSQLVRCNCSICSKKGSLHTRVPPQRFKLMAGADDLALYQFNKKIAKHYFCRHCGIHPYLRPRSTPDLYAINVRCLDDLDADSGDYEVTLFDGRNWEEAFQALQRSQRE